MQCDLLCLLGCTFSLARGNLNQLSGICCLFRHILKIDTEDLVTQRIDGASRICISMLCS